MKNGKKNVDLVNVISQMAQKINFWIFRKKNVSMNIFHAKYTDFLVVSETEAIFFYRYKYQIISLTTSNNAVLLLYANFLS